MTRLNAAQKQAADDQMRAFLNTLRMKRVYEACLRARDRPHTDVSIYKRRRPRRRSV